MPPKWQRPEILEAVFDQLSDAVFLYDKDLSVVGVECRRRGLEPSSCMPTGTVSLHTGNGTLRMVVIRTVQLLDHTGALEGVVATVKDITQAAEPAKRQIVDVIEQ